MTTKPAPRVIVLRAPGTNCDEETAAAWELAGAQAETWHVGRLLEDPASLDRFQILTIPGGFSYGDDLGAGRILATRLGHALGDALRRFHDRGGLIAGICNGFQVLVRCGLLPGPAPAGAGGQPPAPPPWRTTTRASSRPAGSGSCPGPASPRSSPSTTRSSCPSPTARASSCSPITGRWTRSTRPARSSSSTPTSTDRPTQDYPANPNGSAHAAAAVCDPTGRIFGLMPHPERFVSPLHHPRWTRLGTTLAEEGQGLRIFRSAVKAVS